MPSHGDHWETLYDVEDYVQTKLRRDVQESSFVGSASCVDVEGGTDRPEKVTCLRLGGKRLANQVLVVSNSAQQTHIFFSSYPVALDGITVDVTIAEIEPWEHGIEGWMHGKLFERGVSICFFDTMYFSGTAELPVGATVSCQLSGIAYWLRPIQQQSIAVSEGVLWEMERNRRLERGESPQEAMRPVEIFMSGAAIFLQIGGKDAPDDAQFQGVIDAIDTFEHDGQKIWRLELTVLRGEEDGEEDFRLPVYASERALHGYVPRLGEDVEGMLWLQGRRVGAEAALDTKHPRAS